MLPDKPPRIILALSILLSLTNAQPSPNVQKRISAAIEAAGNMSLIDYTSFVNVFIGTGMQSRHST